MKDLRLFLFSGVLSAPNGTAELESEKSRSSGGMAAFRALWSEGDQPGGRDGALVALRRLWDEGKEVSMSSLTSVVTVHLFVMRESMFKSDGSERFVREEVRVMSRCVQACICAPGPVRATPDRVGAWVQW